MKIDFTFQELELLDDMIEALGEGFEYFTEENEEIYDTIAKKVRDIVWDDKKEDNDLFL